MICVVGKVIKVGLTANEKENERTPRIRARKRNRAVLLMVLQSKTRAATTIAAEITPQIIFAGVEKISSLSTIPLPSRQLLQQKHVYQPGVLRKVRTMCYNKLIHCTPGLIIIITISNFIIGANISD